MSDQAVTPHSVLETLHQTRIVEVGKALNVLIPTSANKADQVKRLTASLRFSFERMLRELSRDELRRACAALGLDSSARTRDDLTRRLLDAAGVQPAAADVDEVVELTDDEMPKVGGIVQVRQRQYLVEDVRKGAEGGSRPPMTLVSLACLDDDAPGRHVEVLWELELGARVVKPTAEGLGAITRLDPPAHFAAYLSALRWNCVTATRADLFQAPFRAGIQMMNHQLVPLQRALSLPRANLFIADDVGLGKTIEAGLVMQELQLRQRVDFMLIVCPASVALQWREEMQQKFGLYFEVYDREFVGRRQRERGFGVNPWATHTRFIISYPMLRRPANRDTLLQHIGERVKKSLLVLDEAHTVAPASATSRVAGRYAVDSQLTKVARDVAPRFENRLFLSATPHNGHSNSFTALLALLDPQRFLIDSREPTQPKALEAVMIRRLKSELLAIPGQVKYPRRRLIEVQLLSDGDAWTSRTREDDALGQPVPLQCSGDAGLQLSALLAEYTTLRKADATPTSRLVFVNLQKRLLSSVAAFHHTLEAHKKKDAENAKAALEKATTKAKAGKPAKAAARALPSPSDDENTHGTSASDLDAAEALQMQLLSEGLREPSERARQLLEEMLTIAARGRLRRDAKVAALLAWMREHQCAGVGIADDRRADGDRAWTDTRVIIFTEYGNTLSYLRDQLAGAFAETDRADERIMIFDGAMSDDDRRDVRDAFNGSPESYAVRVLLATDAAREGVNLQGHCADLFHFDVPWNPARLEQRNGRIDRTLQPEDEVRCMYFLYPQRTEDRVLEVLVGKLERIRGELGSLGDVLMDRVGEVMEEGIDAGTTARLEEAAKPDARQKRAAKTLGTRDIKGLKATIDKAGEIMEKSRELLGFHHDQLREVVDVALALTGCEPLTRLPRHRLDAHRTGEAWRLPTMPDGWSDTVDSVRPKRDPKESDREWRARPLLPVVFKPPERMNDPVAHLHLQHPFTQRLLSRFLAQGYASDALSRVSVCIDPDAAQIRVVAFGRLSLFGGGAVRLHDELIEVPALVIGDGVELLEMGDARLLAERLPTLLKDAAHRDPLPASLQAELVRRASGDFAELWHEVEKLAAEHMKRAKDLLKQRGEKESKDLTEILDKQKAALNSDRQTNLFNDTALAGGQLSRDEARQHQADQANRAARRVALDKELANDPPQLKALYHVAQYRIDPVGLLYLWPSTR